MDNHKYFEEYLTFDKNRSKVWKAITCFLNRYISPNDRVMDLGAGYCDLINNINAREKHALDIFPGIKKFAARNVTVHTISAMKLDNFKKDSFDAVTASNFFEHFDRKDFSIILKGIKRILKKNGKLVIIQPNYKYCSQEYFDDPTHKETYTHLSLSRLLSLEGFEIIKVVPRFLPLTMKSKIPKSYLLTRLYLISPVKPLAKQMLIVAKLKKK